MRPARAQALRGRCKAARAVEYPEVGVYHPRLPARRRRQSARDDAAARPAAASAAPSACSLMRSYLLAGNAGHYDGVITALEARGLRVIPAFATGLDARPAIEQFFMTRRPPASTRWSR